MAKFGFDDDSVVVIIGSGAGGTLANELCQKGIKVVVLEAGAMQSNASFINDEWKSFAQLAWLDARTTSGSFRVAKDFRGLPAWICKTVGGTTTHWAGASLRFQEREFKVRTQYGHIEGANLMDWPLELRELEPWYAKAEDKMGVTRTHGIPGLPGNNNFKVMYAGRASSATRRYIPATWPSTASRGTVADTACSSASVSRGARAEPSGPPSTPSCPRRKPPASSICDPNHTLPASSTTPPVR